MDVSFRPLARADFTLLARWIAAPHVAPWWREDSSHAAVERGYGPAVDGDDPTEMFVVVVDGRDIGFVQRYRLDDYPDWSRAIDIGEAAGIDYLIGEADAVGVGIGPVVVNAFTLATLDRHPEITCVAVAVQQDNRASWRALEKAGYDRVFTGMIRSSDPSDDGLSYVYVRRRPPAGAAAS